MNRHFARLLSILLHPVLMPTYALLVIFQLKTYLAFTTQPQVKIGLYIVIVFNTLIMPVLISYLLLTRGFIRSFEMQRRQERIIPFFSNLVLMMVAYYMLRQIVVPKIFYLLLLGAGGTIVLAIIINLKWKISIHMIGIGGVVGMLCGMSTFMFANLRFPILISILVAGLLGTARLSLNAHRPAEIYTGFLVGFFCEYLLLGI